MQNGRFIEADTGKPIANEFSIVYQLPKLIGIKVISFIFIDTSFLS